MITWVALIGTVLLVSFLLNFYIVKKIYELKFLKEMKNRKLALLISFIPFIVYIILIIWDMTNAYTISLHYSLILLIGELIYWIVRKTSKKEYKYGKEITIAVCFIFTTVYLGYAYYLAHHVIETHYDVVATKDIGVDSFRIVQITDSHIGATMDGEDFYNYMLEINKTNPDIVVITGDYIDDDTKDSDLVKASYGLSKLETKYGVYFVYGNHDKGYYSDKNTRLREELIKNNVVILEDKGLDIEGTNIHLFGRQDKTVRNRMTAEEIMNITDKDKFVVVLNHQPNDYDNEEKAGFDLVISGHTHGGQLIPLKYFDIIGSNDRFYGIEKRGNTTFIVSSGIGDWKVKFKTGTVAEYVVIDIKNK